jgi:hypothetical protein
MVDIDEVYVRDLYKKHKGRELYKGFYSIGKKIYQDDGEVVNEGFALGKEALKALSPKIMAILIGDLPNKENKSKHKTPVKINPRVTLYLPDKRSLSLGAWG